MTPLVKDARVNSDQTALAKQGSNVKNLINSLNQKLLYTMKLLREKAFMVFTDFQ